MNDDRTLADCIEPAAVRIALVHPDCPVVDTAVVSIAISLKRLADHLAGSDKCTGLVDAIYDARNPNR